MGTIKIYDIAWEVKGAGPSPADNYRMEIYFAGCAKAREGNPCKGCCNPMIWDDRKAKDLFVNDVYDLIKLQAERGLSKYITFVGGEPTDQSEGVIELAKLLKDDGFHILMFSWHSRDWFESNWKAKDLRLFDIIITEPYVQEEHIYDWTLDDGLHNTVGSGNQHVWYRPGSLNIDVAARDIASLSLDEHNLLKIIMK